MTLAPSEREIEEARAQRAHRQPFRLSSVDSCEQRLAEAVQRLCAEATGRE